MRHLLLVLLLALHFSGQSQMQTWLGVSCSFKPIKKTEISIGLQQRYFDFTAYNKSLLSAELAVKVIKGIKPFIGFRMGLSPNSNSDLNQKKWGFSQRYIAGLDFSFVDWFNEKSRLNIGYTIQNQWNTTSFKRNSSVLRNKLGIKYDIKNFPLSPFVNAEHYYNWKRDITYTIDEVLITGGTTAFRYFIGFDIELPKAQIIQISLGKKNLFLNNNDYWIGSIKYKLQIN